MISYKCLRMMFAINLSDLYANYFLHIFTTSFNRNSTKYCDIPKNTVYFLYEIQIMTDQLITLYFFFMKMLT